MRNYVDADGSPVCLVCGHGILLSQPAARVRDCMVHVACFDEAVRLLEPCTPQR
jgi:hypothetical protein